MVERQNCSYFQHIWCAHSQEKKGFCYAVFGKLADKLAGDSYASLWTNYVWQKVAYWYVKWPKGVFWVIIININKDIIGKNYKKIPRRVNSLSNYFRYQMLKNDYFQLLVKKITKRLNLHTIK